MWLSEEGIAFATNRTLRKLGVNIQPSAVYTYDGNQEGKVTFPQGGVTAVRVGEAVDPNSVQKVIGVLDGQEMEILADAITLSESDDITFLNANGAPFVCIVTGDNDFGAAPGTYATQNEWYYVSRIEVTETTTPIDPKYLPEGVELIDLTKYGYLTHGGQYADSSLLERIEEAITAGKIVVFQYDVELKLTNRTVSYDGMRSVMSNWQHLGTYYGGGIAITVTSAMPELTEGNFYIIACTLIVQNGGLQCLTKTMNIGSFI